MDAMQLPVCPDCGNLVTEWATIFGTDQKAPAQCKACFDAGEQLATDQGYSPDNFSENDDSDRF